jgi:hypothetical protein
MIIAQSKDEGGVLVQIVLCVVMMVMDVEAQVSTAGDKADIDQELMEGAIPCEQCLFQSVQRLSCTKSGVGVVDIAKVSHRDGPQLKFHLVSANDHHPQLHHCYWAEVSQHTTMLINVLPMHTNPSSTSPFKAWYGKLPCTANLHVFCALGC